MDTILMFQDWAWIGWLVLMVLFFVIEIFTLEFTFLMLGLGSAVACSRRSAGRLGAGDHRRPRVRAAHLRPATAAAAPSSSRRGPDPTNVDALIGLHGTVLLEVIAHRAGR
jgi:hypothetical protein